MSRSRSRSRSPIRRGGGSNRRLDRGGGERAGSRIDHKSDRMVYLSNLPWELKWMELKDIIREKAGEVNFVEVLEDRDGRSKGCAVVEFKHKECANKCIENMHRTELRDRLIIAKEIRDPIAFFRKVREDTGIDFLGGGDRPERSRGTTFNERGSSGGGVSINENETFGLSPNFLRQLGISTPLCNRIFITNIPYNSSVGRLFDVFALAGKVTWMDLQMDKEGKSKGMAVCEYSHPIEAVQAVSMLNNQRLHDRTIAVRMDRYPKDQERRDPSGLPVGLRAVGMGLGANGAPLTDVASVISSINPPQIGAMNGTVVPMAAGQMTPFSAQAAPQVPAVNPFQSNALQQQPVQQAAPANYQSPNQPAYQSGGFFNPPQPTNRPTPGIPQFSSQFGSTASKPQSAASVGGGFAPSSQTIAQHTPKFEVAGYGGYGTGPTQNSSGSSGFDGSSRVILIKNLPMDYTWQIVSDRVQQFGDLESVEMITQGVAKVRFMNMKDAQRAKQALEGTTVEGRAIGIEYL